MSTRSQRHVREIQGTENGLSVGDTDIGGVPIGGLGAGLYSGYTLSWGDDFDSLDLLGPRTPNARWFGTRNYSDPGGAPRGTDTILGTMFDTDPLFTGHNDSNRGVAVGYNNMRCSSSILALQCRKATVAEKTHMSSSRNEVSSMLDGVGAVGWYAGVAGTQDIIYEMLARYTGAPTNPAGWHPTMWSISHNLGNSQETDELDYEANSQHGFLMRALHSGGSIAYTSGIVPVTHDGQWHIFSIRSNKSAVTLFIDGVQVDQHLQDGNSRNKPAHIIFTSHVFNDIWDGENYSPTAWNNDANGATLEIDWARVWRRTGKQHFKPLVLTPGANVAYGASVDVVIPPALTLWGDAGVTEWVTAMFHEENEPGVTHTTSYDRFPPGVSYNTGTRTLTVNITSGKTGRINFAVYAWKADGSTHEPARFVVNVGPVLTNVPATLNYTHGDIIDVDYYPLCDCGVLTPGKSMSITGLAGTGLSFDPTTFRLTGTAVGAFSGNIVVSGTNTVGQTVTKNQALTIAAAPVPFAYTSWAGPGWFDASDPACIQVNGSQQVTGMVNKRVGGGDLTGGGTIANRTLVAAAQNGKAAVRIARDVTTNLTPPRMTALVSSLLSTMQQGDDKPHTVIFAFKPTDANTRILWSWSDLSSITAVESIGFVSRASASQTYRRVTNNVGTIGQNVDYATKTHASGTPRVLAVKFLGTTLDVWDNSTTKTVAAGPQNANAFSANLEFNLFVSEVEAASDPAYALTQGNLDFYEIVVESIARSDAEIQQAITDISTKWSIPLV